jgi:MFS family permease
MTEEQSWLSRKFLTYRFLSNLWFLSATWLFFYRLFITDQQIGLLDGFAFAIGLLAEVPSGALADKFGRHKIAGLGQILAGTGLLIQIAGSSFMPFVVGQSVMNIGFAFYSGADEALFYNRLKFRASSIEWRKLLTHGSQVELVATLSATLVGGWLYTINPRLPWLMTAIAFIASSLILWTVKDSRPVSQREPFKKEVKSYLTDIKTGFANFKRPYLKQLYGDDIYAVFQKVKQIFDPYGTLNPGVKINVTLDDIKPLLRHEYSMDHLYSHLPRS